MKLKLFFQYLVPFFIVVAPFIGTALVVPYLIDNYIGLAESFSIQDQFLIFSIASVIIGLGLFPSTLTAIVLGFFYGWRGFLLMCVVYMVASIIGYVIAKANKSFFWSFLAKKKKAILIIEELKEKPFFLIVLLRISPVLPFAWCNYLLGVLEIPFKSYFSSTFVGMIPRTLLSVWVGVELVDLVGVTTLNDQVIYKIGGIVLLFISSAGLGVLGKRVLNKVSNE